MRRNTPICQIVANVLAGQPVVLPEESAQNSAIPVKKLTFAQVTALPGASIKSENGGYRLITSASRDPQDKLNAIKYVLQDSVDCTSYLYLTFHIKDLQGSNTHKVTLTDARGNSFSTWVDIPSVHKQWTRIYTHGEKEVDMRSQPSAFSLSRSFCR